MIRLYFAVSLDGFIADEAGNVGWLDAFAENDFGFTTFLASIETLVMGRTTYDQARSFEYWPYDGKRIIVLTSRALEPLPEDVGLATGGPEGLAALLPSLGAGDVWIMGGARAMGAFLDLGIVDRIDLFIMPVMLGRGIPMFRRDGGTDPGWQLEHSHAFPSGVVHLAYLASEPLAAERAD
ncbi:MAG TPA: dihydrofolate reductase family protein [Candidatus Baltobacteraceae bacterium]|jgi:dihydrofolate reductase